MDSLPTKTYKRARTEQQRRERLDDILRTADSLLSTTPYRYITLDMIARELGYSRANLSHYVKSKEEIFLLLYVQSLQNMLAEFEGAAIESGNVSADSPESVAAIANKLAAIVAGNENFGRIGALLASIVETNVTLEQLTACKREIVRVMEEAALLLVRGGIIKRRDQAAVFLADLANYVAGLYPASHPIPLQREASEEAGYPIQDYREALVAYISIQLTGMHALMNEERQRTLRG